MSEDRDEESIRIAGIDGDRRDLLPIAQTAIAAVAAYYVAQLLPLDDPRPVFAAAGALTLLTVTVAWFAGLRREQLPASILAS